MVGLALLALNAPPVVVAYLDVSRSQVRMRFEAETKLF
jgi:hypothetical protein